MQKYGGVNNKKALNEIQEARIVSVPGMSRITKKRSLGTIIAGWIAYLIISYIFTELLLIITTDAWNNTKMPLWAIFILPSTPFLLTLFFKIIAIKKHTNQNS